MLSHSNTIEREGQINMDQAALVNIVEFNPSHIGSARALWRESEGVGLSGADEPSALVRFLDRNPGLSFVAQREGQVVGTVLCGHDGRRGLIHHLVVSAACRREGLGRELLKRGMLALRAADIAKAHLLVFRSNEGGLAFWRSVGAEERGSIALFSVATENGG